MCLPVRLSLIGRLAPDRFLDLVQRADTLQRLGVPSVSSIVHVAAGSAQAASATPEALTRQPRIATVSIEQAGDAPRCAPLTVAGKQSINGVG